MASLRTIRKRIASVKNTAQITKTMKMVSAAKLRRAQEALLAARPYAERMFFVLSSLAARTDPARHKLLTRREVHAHEALVITSDRGLCGAFNNNVLRRAHEHLTAAAASVETLRVTAIGKKARDFFRRRAYPVRRDYVGVSGRPMYADAALIAGEIIEAYEAAEVDEVSVISMEFRSALSQRVVVERLLPIEPMPVAAEAYLADYLFEPSEAEILHALLQRYVEVRLFHALLESVASELGARMTAMDNATRNAHDMIGALTLFYNRTRQAAITKELMEVVGGAEALRKARA